MQWIACTTGIIGTGAFANFATDGEFTQGKVLINGEADFECSYWISDNLSWYTPSSLDAR